MSTGVIKSTVTPLSDGPFTFPGFFYISGIYRVKATNPANGQSVWMNGECNVVVNPLPQIYQLTAQNGDHCSPVIPELGGSQSDVDYTLYLNGSPTTIVVSGTGLPGFLTLCYPDFSQCH